MAYQPQEILKNSKFSFAFLVFICSAFQWHIIYFLLDPMMTEFPGRIWFREKADSHGRFRLRNQLTSDLLTEDILAPNAKSEGILEVII